jgi:hypothetical protein
VLVRIGADASNWDGYVVTYDVEQRKYQLLRTRITSLRDVNVKLFSRDGRPRIPNPLAVAEVLCATPAIPEMIDAIMQLLSESGVEEDDENNH